MNKEIDGFIFKANVFDQNDQMNFHFYGNCEAGPFKIILNKEQSYFFAESSQENNWKTIDGKKAQKVSYKSLKEKKQFSENFQNQMKRTYEFDVRPIERFLMDKNIYGSIRIKGTSKTENNLLVFINPDISLSNYYPTYKLLSFDIETAKSGEILSIAYQVKNNQFEVSKVLMLGEGKLESNEIEICFCRTEVDLISSFQNELKQFDPDIIIGWNVIGFDLKYIFDRCEFHKIKFDLGRVKNETRMYQNARGDWAIDIPGRVVIDGPWALKMNFFSFESFKLNEVAKKLLDDTKDIDEDEVFDKWGEIERRYREDKLSLARYNLKDALLVTQIFEKTKLMDLLLNRSIISGMLLDKVGGSTAAFDHFFLPEFHKFNYVAPNVIDVNWDREAKGGFVLNPKVGIHENVVVLDFKSLYPTVIRTFLIDPLSRLERNGENHQTPVGITFSNTHHILPNKISELLKRRSEAKKIKNENLSMAIKILMNSFYGVMGSSGCRFYHHELPDAITGSGQWVLKTTIEFLESNGYEILYGDTDSIFVKVKEFETIFEKGIELVNLVNSFLTVKIINEFKVESHLEIQFDKVFKKLILTSTRNTETGAKKRYAGLLAKKENENLKEEIILTGMEFVRSDWSRIARDFQYELVRKIFNNEDVKSYVLEKIADLEQGKYDQDLILKKRLTKNFEEYIRNIPPQAKAAKLLFEKYGIRKKTMEYVMTKRGAMPIEFNPLDIDYDYYIEKQLAPIANSILQLIGQSFEKIRDQQLTLF